MKHLDFDASIAGTLALESEDVGGEAQEELEYAIYTSLSNNDWRNRATKAIYQLQSGIKGKTPGSQLRVRKAQELNPTTLQPVEDIQYIFTGKAPDPKTDGLKEKNQETDAEMLDIFLVNAKEYMEKTRYEVPSEKVPGNSPWQVDTFKDKDGNPSPFVKIDLEFPSASGFKLELKDIPFPFDENDIHITLKGEVIHGNRERINWMFENVFSKKLD